MARRRPYLRRVRWHARSAEVGDPAAPALTFAVIGDSTAEGVGARSFEETYPYRLALRLGASRRVRLEVLGFSGARMNDAAGEQAPAAAALVPDLVLVAVGTNDVTHLTPLRLVRRSLARLLDVLSASEAAVVLAGPAALGTVRALAQPLRAIAGLRGRAVQRLIREESLSRRLPFVDVAGATAAAFGADPDRYLCRDLFHLSGDGYARWADAMAPAVLAAAPPARQP